MNKKQRERFLELIAFLKGLPRQKFNFAWLVAESEKSCGTVCCAMGWTPKLFPKLVEWVESSDAPVQRFRNQLNIVSKTTGDEYFENIAEELFGIPSRLALHLFVPAHQKVVHDDLPDCSTFSSPVEVAAMLKKFLSLMDKKAINLKHY